MTASESVGAEADGAEVALGEAGLVEVGAGASEAGMEEPGVAAGVAASVEVEVEVGVEPAGLAPDASSVFDVAPSAVEDSMAEDWVAEDRALGDWAPEDRAAGSFVSAGFVEGTVLPVGASPAFNLSAMSLGAEVFGPTFGIEDAPAAGCAGSDAAGAAVGRASGAGASAGRASGAGASAARDSGGGEDFRVASELAGVAGALSPAVFSSATLSPAGFAADASARVDFPDEIPVFAGLFVLRAKSSPPAVVARDSPGTFDNT